MALVALKEDYDSVKFIMESLINPDTKCIVEDCLHYLKVMSMFRLFAPFRYKILLYGAGGASCHLSTASYSQIASINWVTAGFAINRFISDAKLIFEEVNQEEYFKLSSKQRTGITHQPTSEINIVSASPFHAYLCVFRWFMLLIYHLDAGHKVWSPTNSKIQASMRRFRSIIKY